MRLYVWKKTLEELYFSNWISWSDFSMPLNRKLYVVLSRQLNFNIHYHLKVIYFLLKIRIVQIEKSNKNLWFIYAFHSVMYFNFFSIMPNMMYLLSLFKRFWLLGEQVKWRFGLFAYIWFYFSTLFESLDRI